MLLPVLLPEPVLDPEELGGFVEGLPLPESGLVVVLGGFEVVPLLAPDVPCPELSVAELPELLLPDFSAAPCKALHHCRASTFCRVEASLGQLIPLPSGLALPVTYAAALARFVAIRLTMSSSSASACAR